MHDGSCARRRVAPRLETVRPWRSDERAPLSFGTLHARHTRLERHYAVTNTTHPRGLIVMLALGADNEPGFYDRRRRQEIPLQPALGVVGTVVACRRLFCLAHCFIDLQSVASPRLRGFVWPGFRSAAGPAQSLHRSRVRCRRHGPRREAPIMTHRVPRLKPFHGPLP